MLSIAVLRSDHTSYYLSDLSREFGSFESLFEGVGANPGLWVGRGSRALRLSERVDEDSFKALFNGRLRSQGPSLVAREHSVGAFDLTFSAPKSVSLLMAFGDREVSEGVIAAHLKAVAGGIEYLESHALAVRRRNGSENTLIGTDGAIAAAFTHGVSRALDPHLHSHVVLVNLAHGLDSRWSAIDGRGLFAHREAAGSLYESELRFHLYKDLGFAWQARVGNQTGFEIAGISPFVIAGFSNRSAEIHQNMADHGSNSKKANRVAWAATREPKDLALSTEEIMNHWKHLARDLDLDTKSIGKDRQIQKSADHALDEQRFTGSLIRDVHSVVHRHDAVFAWSNALINGSKASEVGLCIDQLKPDTSNGHPMPAWKPLALNSKEPLEVDSKEIIESPVELGVRESGSPVSLFIPPAYLINNLGPRPALSVGLKVWVDAARSLESYRIRWRLQGNDLHFDTSSSTSVLGSMTNRQFADHLRTVGKIRQATRRLGRDTGRNEINDRGLDFH